MSEWSGLTEIVPESRVGCASVEHFDVEDGFWSWKQGIPPGRYIRLMVNGTLMMSNTPFEKMTNTKIRFYANGRVLIAGLGVGAILPEVLSTEAVESVLVVEKYQDVIDIVAPRHAHPKLSVVCGDINKWRPVQGELFDTIYFDIWPEVSTDCLVQMGKLHRAFSRHLNRSNPKAWMDSWLRDDLRSRKRREQRSARWY